MLAWLCSRAARAQIPADLTPWYAAFRDGLRHTSLCHDSEMLEQPILLLAVVMSTEDDPIARFDELLRPENLPPPLRAETQHYDPDVPRMCVLVHDLGLHQGALTDAAKVSFEPEWKLPWDATAGLTPVRHLTNALCGALSASERAAARDAFRERVTFLSPTLARLDMGPFNGTCDELNVW